MRKLSSKPSIDQSFEVSTMEGNLVNNVRALQAAKICASSSCKADPTVYFCTLRLGIREFNAQSAYVLVQRSNSNKSKLLTKDFNPQCYATV